MDPELRADARRIATFLLAGHGAALLLVFNARANGNLAPSEGLRSIAISFALGLVFSFWMMFLLSRQAQRRVDPLGLSETEKDRNAEQHRRSQWIGHLALGSIGAFLIGLLGAIEFLGPPA